jgi:hypothetical protein
MTAHPLLNTLSEIGVKVSIQDDRLRLTGNLQELTDTMKADLHREKAAIMATLGNLYPNQDGLVKCTCCQSWQDKRCTHGYHPDGISLLRKCGDFRFNRA